MDDAASGQERPGTNPERTREDQRLFERHLAGDARARAELVERFLPLAKQLARRYQRSEEPMDDLVQVASLGLLKAIDRFDPVRGIAFSSFAVPTILGELKRHFRDKTWSVRVPREMQERALRVERVVSDLTGETNRPPTVADIAGRTGDTEEDVLEAMQAGGAYRATSIDAPRGGSAEDPDTNGGTVGDALGADEGGFDLAEDRATIDRLMSAVNDRDREVLRLRFEEDMTQAEIGELIGVSQMQVSRILRRALARLRISAGVGG